MNSWSNLEEFQPLACRILTNSIRNNRISHAYLINGLRGTGKESLANLFAMSMFCEEKSDVEPCGECVECKRVLSRNHPDVYWIEKDGQSIKNDQIDLLRKEFSFSSATSDRRIYVIKDADALTVNAANRLLKFLEEPAIETTAILLTSNVQAIIPTIRSRCQLIDLLPISSEALVKELIDLKINENNARLLSSLTNNIDEAITYNETEKVYLMRDLVVQLIDVLINNYEERFLFIHQHWLRNLKDRQDLETGLEILLIAFNDIVKYQIEAANTRSNILNNDLLSKTAYTIPQKSLLGMIKNLLGTRQKFKQNVNPTLAMEEFVLQL